MSALLEDRDIKALIKKHSRKKVTEVLREALSHFARTIGEGGQALAKAEVKAKARDLLAAANVDRLRPVVNGMGILLHTGLGRAPLAKEAAEALSHLHMCCNLQVDMEDGQRGKRNYMSEKLICELTGAEAAVIVNNNAAATFLILKVFAAGRECIVSRGQLIEIGGSFRLPDLMAQSGATMVEVGTTNKTHLRDYENAMSENTGAILRVFPSNFRVVGFTKSVSIEELATLKKKQDFILVDDLGCGALVDLEKWGLPLEPTVPGSIRRGADLICSSGDKLIGGPQAGIIVGRKDLIQKIKKHPMTRLLRVCKMTDTALEQTLRLFLEPDNLLERHPVFRMMTTPMDKLKRKAGQIKRTLERDKLPFHINIVEEQSAVGGGSMPDHPLDTYALALSSPKFTAEQLSRKLREGEPPVLARISKKEVLIDMRTLLDGEEKIVAEAIRRIAAS
jgi:L-seryl-tRNA(Ser) seleniumtransferase